MIRALYTIPTGLNAVGHRELARRAYEFNTRAIQTSDNMLESTATLIR